jgi:hypothetical protein
MNISIYYIIPIQNCDILFHCGVMNRCGMFGEECLSLAVLVKYNSKHSSREAVCFFCNATTLYVNMMFSSGLQIKELKKESWFVSKKKNCKTTSQIVSRGTDNGSILSAMKQIQNINKSTGEFSLVLHLTILRGGTGQYLSTAIFVSVCACYIFP